MFAMPQSSDVFAVLENTLDPDSPARLYTRPVGTVVARTGAELIPALEALDRLQAYAVGYVSYEAGYALQGIPLPEFAADPLRPIGPLLHFELFEHSRALSSAETVALLDALAGAEDCAIHDAELAESEANYSRKVAQIRALIRSGDTYQVNYTLPYRFRHTGNAAALYRSLRQTQRVAYAAFLNFPEVRVLSLSPELFLWRSGNRLTARPMKGTAPRGTNLVTDAKLQSNLRNDPKSRAENVMIVDLLRNDIGSIATIGSVETPSLFAIETYETLHQMTSTVTGQLPEGTRFSDVMRHLFPCGSITGAPKHRTMQIIAELEQEPRGIYTGAVGYLEPGGDFCLNVPIRTVVSHLPGIAEMGVGSGIVFDSRAADEYAEVLLKTQFLHGVNRELGLIESMRWDPATGLMHLDLHLERLRGSARVFGFSFDEKAIRQALTTYVSQHRPSDARRCRIELRHDGSLDIADFAIPALPDQATIVVSAERIDSASIFRRHKTTARTVYESEYARATGLGHYEVLFLNEHGRVAEASRHNVFIERNGMLLTPPVGEGALPGILRQTLIESGRAREGMLTPDALAAADAVYVGNAVRGLQRVVLS